MYTICSTNIELKAYLYIPVVHKLGFFCADRTVLVLQTLEVADQCFVWQG
jgi:hypothetical protein